MDKKKQIKAILAAAACHVAWGFSFLASRKGLDAAPVFVLLSHRFGLSFLTMNLLVLLGVTVLVTVIDYIVPAWFTKLTGGSKYASWGAILGLFAGLIFPLPFGMIVTSLLGAFAFEFLFAGKGAGSSVKASLGAFLGFLSGTGIKLIASAVMMYYIIVYI